MRHKRLISTEEAQHATGQHIRPCGDCPFTRESLAGWLGGATGDEYAALAHSDAPIGCHVYLDAHCAGAAIYRANVGKAPRVAHLTLEKDTETLFGTRLEFVGHHIKNFSK